jgi:hypothetical protein
MGEQGSCPWRRVPPRAVAVRIRKDCFKYSPKPTLPIRNRDVAFNSIANIDGRLAKIEKWAGGSLRKRQSSFAARSLSAARLAGGVNVVWRQRKMRMWRRGRPRGWKVAPPDGPANLLHRCPTATARSARRGPPAGTGRRRSPIAAIPPATTQMGQS